MFTYNYFSDTLRYTKYRGKYDILIYKSGILLQYLSLVKEKK